MERRAWMKRVAPELEALAAKRGMHLSYSSEEELIRNGPSYCFAWVTSANRMCFLYLPLAQDTHPHPWAQCWGVHRLLGRREWRDIRVEQGLAELQGVVEEAKAWAEGLGDE